MEQGVALAQAECRDEAVDRLADRLLPLAELAIVPSGLCREFDSARLEDLEAPPVTEDPGRFRVVRYPCSISHTQRSNTPSR